MSPSDVSVAPVSGFVSIFHRTCYPPCIAFLGDPWYQSFIPSSPLVHALAFYRALSCFSIPATRRLSSGFRLQNKYPYFVIDDSAAHSPVERTRDPIADDHDERTMNESRTRK